MNSILETTRCASVLGLPVCNFIAQVVELPCIIPDHLIITIIIHLLYCIIYCISVTLLCYIVHLQNNCNFFRKTKGNLDDDLIKNKKRRNQISYTWSLLQFKEPKTIPSGDIILS